MVATTWAHLRLSLTCGHAGCCGSSLQRHSRAHAHLAAHPVIRSTEPGEDPGWSYADELLG